jgi:chromosome partitioning protein
MKPFIIVVAHQKGGVGKSTISFNLLVELSKDFTCRAVDLDAQKSLTIFNSKREKKLNVLHVKNTTEFKELVNNNKDLIIVDVAGIDSDLNRLALLAADLLITPVSDSEIELFGLMNFKRILQEVKQVREELKATVLLNRVHPRATASAEEIREFISNSSDFELFDTVLRDRADFKKSFGAGKSVVEYKKDGAAAAELKQLIKEIKQWLN